MATKRRDRAGRQPPKLERPASKPIHWMGSSQNDLTDFPLPVKRVMGFCLRKLQEGQDDERVKPMTGHDKFKGSRVREIIDDYDTDTYRTVVAAKFPEALYVLHAFKKKSKRGISTPQKDIDLIVERLKAVEELRRKAGLKG
ncbi:MAG TPA: type II toxin-antitoxin system RelE/ParE family toxin [Acetobacteraceae bacterium]|jgi:phage-related protein|nr:type II toxin-antitoxin system RelE/ParE family toxin [Acetobacteraceae bacterium]